MIVGKLDMYHRFRILFEIYEVDVEDLSSAWLIFFAQKIIKPFSYVWCIFINLKLKMKLGNKFGVVFKNLKFYFKLELKIFLVHEF